MTMAATPISEASLAQSIEALQLSNRAFEAARQAALGQEAEAAKMRANADAAEADARHAKEARQLLIKNGSKATKKLRDLVADERAAYSLAEDYRAVAQERQDAWEEAKEHAEDQAKAMLQARDGAVELHSRHQLAAALAESSQLFKAIRLHRSVCVATDGKFSSSIAKTLGYESPDDRAFSEVFAVLKEHLQRQAQSPDDLYKPFAMAEGWEAFDPRKISLAQRNRRRVLGERDAQAV